MKKGAKRSFVVIGGLVGLYVLNAVGFFSFLTTLPWWMYFVVAGILFSGYRFLVESRSDREADQEWIEEQGKEYMNRIELERKKRSS